MAATAGAFALAGPATASADQLVTNTNDSGAGSLRDAVAAAAANTGPDTITFDSSLSGSTITLTTGPIVVSDNYDLTINGPGAANLTVSGGGNYQIFNVQHTDGPQPGLTISGLTLSGGHGASAGAIYTDTDTSVALSGLVISGNTATGAPSSGSSYDADYSGGGITATGIMTISNSVISGNDSTATAGKYGGGGIEALGRMAISGSTVSGNTAAGAGGAIFVAPGKYGTGGLQISNTTISGNSSNSYGGAMAVSQLTKYSGNVSTVANTTISGNSATNGAGGIAFKYLGGPSRFTVSHSTVSGNQGGSSAGGGIAIGYVPGSLEVLDSTVSGNTAAAGAGAFIYGPAAKYPGAVQFNNSTIASNAATDAGGGLFLTDFYTGPYSTAPSPIQVTSTILGDNTASGAANDVEDESSAAPDVQLSFSLAEAPGSAGITQSPGGSSILGVDPQLGGLASNGGPTKTQMPAATSPVVDQGISPGPLTTDQRGSARRVNTSVPNAADGTDIGAVELATGPAPGAPTVYGPKHKLTTRKKFVKVKLFFSSSVPDVSFVCSVDGKPFVPCTSPFVAKLRSKPGKGRKHKIAVAAVDPAGNVQGQPQVLHFKVIKKRKK